MYRFVFPFSLFLSAGLLFIIQPMVAKVLLPVYGGTPAVWTVCMLFFQILLLVSYAYAWVLSRFQGLYPWRLIHLLICLLSLLTWPIAFFPTLGLSNPEMGILSNLLIQLGLPLLVVGSSAPLLQFAYGQTSDKQASDPYFLYVASNAGSLIALLSYPFLVERYTGVIQQFHVWNVMYLVYLCVLLGLLFTVHYKPVLRTAIKAVNITWLTKGHWIFLSFIPCSLMLGVTFYISTDVAATPLFWVLPLALYLLSFVITFATKPLVSHAFVQRSIRYILFFPILGFIFGANQVPAAYLMMANLAGFFMLALLCHGELIHTRPPAEKLTTFYFCLALGGVLAGVFNGILAPRVFLHAYEYPLAMLLALLCLPNNRERCHRLRGSLAISPSTWLMPGLVFALLFADYYFSTNTMLHWFKARHVVDVLVVCLVLICSRNAYSLFYSMVILFVFLFMPWFNSTQVLEQQRNFYGVKQVFSEAGAHVLMSQSTLHGFQLQGETPTDGARAYYGPVFSVVQRLQSLYTPLHAMVLGLGTGIMACQFRESDQLTMVEIDEQVISIARNPHLFTYLQDCAPKTTLVKADGLLATKKAKDGSFEVLVMDAFNSDAIPVHLLTLEAFTLYKQKITTDGVILVNVTNRHLRVLPVITAAGQELDMIVLHKKQSENNRLGQFASEWVMLTMNEHLASEMLSERGWHFVAEAGIEPWTNDYSNIMSLLKWRSA